MIGIYCPTLGRSHKLEGLSANIEQTTTVGHSLVLVVEKHDTDSYETATKLHHPACVLMNKYEPSYSNSIQTAYEARRDEFFVCANDDFEFTPGWDVEAMKVMNEGWDVVGLDDDAPTCTFSTILLVRRSYIEKQSGVVDMPNRVMYPYIHNYVDTELYQTALARRVYAAAPKSIVRHVHPDWGKAQMDKTYLKTRGSLSEDGRTFNERAHLWQSLMPSPS